MAGYATPTASKDAVGFSLFNGRYSIALSVVADYGKCLLS